MIGEVIAVVARDFGVSELALWRRGRGGRAMARERQVVMWLARNVLGLSYLAVARALGRDHAMVMWGCRKTQARIAADAAFTVQVAGVALLFWHGETTSEVV